MLGQEYVVIGVLRRIAELIDRDLLSPQDALLATADELEEGLKRCRAGETKQLHIKQLLNGQLIGDEAEPEPVSFSEWMKMKAEDLISGIAK